MIKRLENFSVSQLKVGVDQRCDSDIVIKNYSGKSVGVSGEIFRKAAKITMDILKINKNIGIGLIFTNKNLICQLNKKYRKKDKSTDVLSFGSINDSLGDIVICPEVADEEKNLFGLSFRWMLVKLFIHGFLHFLGYNHIKGVEKQKMADLENKILNKVIA